MKSIKKQEIETVIEYYRKGGMIIVRDDESRENEGDLMISSEYATPSDISFMAKYGRGLICMAIQKHVAEKLNLPVINRDNKSRFSTAFTVSVDARDGTTTGISAFDRVKTIQTILNPDSTEDDLNRPGHLFPIVADPEGLRRRQGHTEAAVELGRLAGHHPSGIICEIMADDGNMMRGEELELFAKNHSLPMLTIEALTEYLYEEKEATHLPTRFGNFHLYHFESQLTQHMPHIALVHKDIDPEKTVTVRVHSECLTGDLFGSLRCDCGSQLEKSLEIIYKKKGALLYMRQEGRGIGLIKKLEAYRLQDKKLDTVEANLRLGFKADERRYSAAAAILKELGIKKINLLTNNPAKIMDLESEGITIVKRIPIETGITDDNRDYLQTKKIKMNHLLKLEEA